MEVCLMGTWVGTFTHIIIINNKKIKCMNLVLEVPFSVLKKGVSQYFCPYSVCTSMYKKEFLAQGLHLKSHQRSSAGIRTLCRPVKFFHTDWINHFFFNLALYTEALSC